MNLMLKYKTVIYLSITQFIMIILNIKIKANLLRYQTFEIRYVLKDHKLKYQLLPSRVHIYVLPQNIDYQDIHG